jgi:peptide/nickel transport system substrate-binding protein
LAKDGLTYEFVIRKNAKFHSGDPVTADDVKFSFERYRGSGAKVLRDKMKDVQVVAPNRVRFVLKEPWPDFMAFYGTSATGAGWIVPKKYIEKVGDEGFNKAPIGAGPFKFAAFNPGVELTLEAFPEYWRKAPHVKRIVMRSIPDENTRAAALKAGEVDIAYLFAGPIAAEVKKTTGLRLVAPILYGIYWPPPRRFRPSATHEEV